MKQCTVILSSDFIAGLIKYYEVVYWLLQKIHRFHCHMAYIILSNYVTGHLCQLSFPSHWGM